MNTQLALLGGEKTLTKKSSALRVNTLPEKAYTTVKELMDKNEISTSPIVESFEKRFASYIGVNYGLCVCNGTTSIQAGLFAVGVKPGDEVIVPSFTFWASAGPIIAIGAIPRFADIDLDTHEVSASSIERLITKKTRAIIAVHVWGNPCDMDAIMAVANKHGVKVVEDCSHAHGATYKGRKVGSFGAVGCFSLQGSKVLSAGEGGILVTNDRECFERAVAMGHYERCKALGEDSEYSRYALTGFGFKHRIHPLAVAIADANMDDLDELNEARYQNARRLEELLSDLPFIKFQKEYDGAKKVFAYHYAQYFTEKLGGLSLKLFLKAVAAEGVNCGSCGYGKLHQAPLYTKDGAFANDYPFVTPEYPTDLAKSDLPNTTILAQSAFMIAGRLEKATEEDLQAISAAYHKVADNVNALLEYQKEQNLGNEIENDGRSINYVKV
ncbi:MAG: DegT/DnrJ/EryC1/StrS family aminotransferase [Ruminococcaceae bacterium]|nr:DegT/DnrJ/EryC1/StrS family aminotransferase [Oscillospiraceae bacterium]